MGWMTKSRFKGGYSSAERVAATLVADGAPGALYGPENRAGVRVMGRGWGRRKRNGEDRG